MMPYTPSSSHFRHRIEIVSAYETNGSIQCVSMNCERWHNGALRFSKKLFATESVGLFNTRTHAYIHWYAMRIALPSPVPHETKCQSFTPQRRKSCTYMDVDIFIRRLWCRKNTKYMFFSFCFHFWTDLNVFSILFSNFCLWITLHFSISNVHFRPLISL